MTVKELREILVDYAGSLPVYINDFECGAQELRSDGISLDKDAAMDILLLTGGD
jgi:hypothetical protein